MSRGTESVFAEMLKRAGEAVQAAVPGILFVLIITDGETDNMTSNITEFEDAEALITGAFLQLHRQGIPPYRGGDS